MNDQASAVREEVRARYAEAARAVLEPETGAAASCCGSPAADSCCGAGPASAEAVGGFSSGLYREGETDGLPEEAVLASLGCGNPIAVADLHQGERVLDLGSGGGIDVLLSARRVGPSGFAYGVDMTDEMLELARANAARSGAGNVEFLKGEIEDLPLPEAAVDVVISNCVINLSVDKPAVLAEMFRVLAPGGRIGITNVVAEDHLTAADRADRRLLRRLHRRRPVPRRVPRRARRGRVHGCVGHLHPRGSPRHALGGHPGRQARHRMTGEPVGASGRVRPGQETAASRGARRLTRSATRPARTGLRKLCVRACPLRVRTRSSFMAFPVKPGVMRAFPDVLACDFAQSRS